MENNRHTSPEGLNGGMFVLRAAVVALQCARGIGRMRGAKRRAEGIARPEGTRPKKGQKKGLRCDGTLDLMRLSGF